MVSLDGGANQPTTTMQWLVDFCNKTLVLNYPSSLENDPNLQQSLLYQISFQTGWPVSHLLIQSFSAPYASVRVQSSLRGGKGGFGTLLRSSARQSGAKLTTDFGACRDLQGRRLRHVNDEIKLRKWREAQERKKQGQDVDATDSMFDTPSGLYNWHLMVPSWADVSKKATRKIQRQFKRMQQEEDAIEAKKQEEKAQYERSVTLYVQRSTEASAEIKNDIMSAVTQGLQAQREKKRKRRSPSELAQKKADQNTSLCTLSGEVVVEEKSQKQVDVLQIQSQSDFSTLALFLDQQPSKSNDSIMYYEVKLVTGGLAQIGWADITQGEFQPNTEEGDGVGDDKGSYGYDGSRGLKFHNGTEVKYEGSNWKAGDIVGCLFHIQSGEISYTLNGKELGVAFSVPKDTVLFPALSCNGGEILELHVQAKDMEFMPKKGKGTQYVAVKELIAANIIDSGAQDQSDKQPVAEEEEDAKLAAKPATEDSKGEQQPETEQEEKKEPEAKKEPEKKKEPVKVEALDLNQYQSAAELEDLGLDRLKGALMAIGVKCGGSLKERAARLISLKGLERKDYPKKVRAKNFVV